VIASSRSDRLVLERLSLWVLDVVAFAAGMRLAYAAYLAGAPRDVTAPPAQFGEYGPETGLGLLIAVQVAVLTVLFFTSRLYHQPRSVSRIDLVAQLLRAVSIGVILTYAATSLLFPRLEYSRRIPLYDWLITFIAVLGLRLLHRAIWGALRRSGVGRDRILVVGSGEEARDLVTRIQSRPSLGYEVVGLVDDVQGRARARGVPILGGTDELAELVDKLQVDEVLIALPEASRQRLLGLMSQCARDGLTVRIYPDVFQILASEVQVGHLDGLPLLTMHDVALRGWRRTVKRLIDIAISGTALVFLSPFLILAAVLVKLESPGPAFYVQVRMGLDARPFPILKLRSMRADAERDTGAVWATREDPRRTRLGRFLRRASIDELPQLVNVLLGHMSIVGPRPERPEFVREFQRQIPRYMERHREKSGLTGWAQVNGLRGSTSIDERTKYDLYYIENWSLSFDLKIMALTVLQFVRDPNAY
jgi:exopolysaccharide biosynthesis polyprenyl glycosylphosphotransferase